MLAAPAAVGPNVDIGLELQDAAGNVLASSNPEYLLGADLGIALAPGTYYLKVQGVGRGDGWGEGYSNYGCIGYYALSGSITTGTAPAIATQPQSQMVSPGATVTFTVVASGTAPLSYQWRRNGLAITGATSATLTVSNAQPADAGAYDVVVSNAHGTLTSAAATLSLSVTSGVIAVATGAGHTLFLRADGTLWAMGRNDSGQLGDGTLLRRTSPVQVATNVASMSAGGFHSLFVKIDGTLWGTGANWSGQLGDGTTTARISPVPLGSAVAAAAGGNAHSVFVKTDGSLWAVGQNASGQLGDGTRQNRLLPVQVANGVIAAAAGEGHTMFVQSDGTLWGMGGNSDGRLGDGSTIDRLTPVQAGTDVIAVECGSYHTFFLRRDGGLWGMGYNYAGSFGDGTTIDHATPVQLATDAIAIAPGYIHNLYVRAGAILWAVGGNGEGQLGGGTTTFMETVPRQVATGVHAATAHTYHSLFVKNDGSLWAMGANSEGQLGDGSLTRRTSPVQIASGTVAVPAPAAVVAGDGSAATHVRLSWLPVIGATSYEIWRATSNASAAATQLARAVTVPFFHDGTAAPGVTYYYWVRPVNPGGISSFGTADAGARGSGTAPGFTIQPAAMSVSAGTPAVFTVAASGDPAPTYQWERLAAGSATWHLVANGGSFTGATSTTLTVLPTASMNGDQYRCAATNAGGTSTSVAVRLTVIDLPGVIGAAMGDSHSLFLRADGSLWAAGRNHSGQLGDGTLIDRTRAIQVATSVVTMAAGGWNSALVKSDGSLWTAGANGGGQLGTGVFSGTGSWTPVASNAVAVAVGNAHILFIKADGTLWGMGNNSYGQLGLPAVSVGVATPQPIATNVVACSTNQYHSMFVKEDGTLWAMGANEYFQLGDGTGTMRTTPVQVATGVVAAAAGAYHSMFLKSDGTAWAMGNNSSGQFGLGTATNSALPVQMTSGVVAIGAGSSHNLLLKVDGTLWGTGYNYHGQLGFISEYPGVGTLTQLATGVGAFAAGGHSSFYLTTAGLAGMGENGYGQLGDGTTTQRLTPVAIAGGTFTLPLAPTSVAASDGSSTDTIRVTWTPVVGATRYEVWRNTGPEAASATRLAAQIGTVVFADTSAPAGMLHHYWVKAANVAGVSGFSSSDSGYRGTPAQLPVILAQPQSRTVTAGASANFTIAFSSNVATTVQWRRNSVALAGATSETYTISPVQLADAGNYDAVLSNAAGSVTSQIATLTVNPATNPDDYQFTTLAGGVGVIGFVDGAGAAARFSGAYGVATDLAGNLFVADWINDAVRRVSPAGVVTTVLGTTAGLGTPSGVAVDFAGNVYIADEQSNVIRKLTPSGVLTTLAGSAGTAGGSDGSGTLALFDGPADVALSPAGDLYVADFNNHTIRKVSPAGVVTTFAGTRSAMGGAVDGVGAVAQFNGPRGIAVDLDGNVFVADSRNHTIRRITPAGIVTTLAGLAGTAGSADGSGTAARFNEPRRLATDAAGNLFVADSLNHVARKISPDGRVSTIGGTAGSPGSADGTGSTARFNYPTAVAVSPSGVLYVGDLGNRTVRAGVAVNGAGPEIVRPPTGLTRSPGETAVFLVGARGKAPLSFQWRKNGVLIAGATNAGLILPSVQVTDAGSYTVTVSNALATTTSPLAELQVPVAAPVAFQRVGGAGGYVAGGRVTISNTLAFPGALGGIGWEVLLPEGWSFAGGAGAQGEVRPAAGTTGLLEWAWTGVPASPFTFTYTLLVPETETVARTLAARVILRAANSDGRTDLLAQPDPLVVARVLPHTADTDRDFQFSLLELTRVIELYNTRNGTSRTGCYAAASASEDGFTSDAARVPGTTITLARYHAADTDRNGRIDLAELTRMIQLYNHRDGTIRTGQYHIDGGGEDGFALGP